MCDALHTFVPAMRGGGGHDVLQRGAGQQRGRRRGLLRAGGQRCRGGEGLMDAVRLWGKGCKGAAPLKGEILVSIGSCRVMPECDLQ